MTENQETKTLKFATIETMLADMKIEAMKIENSAKEYGSFVEAGLGQMPKNQIQLAEFILHVMELKNRVNKDDEV